MKTLIRSPFFPSLLGTKDEFLTPFSQIFDDIFERDFPQFKHDCGLQFSKMSYPKVDVIDDKYKIQIIAEIAGWSKEDISIEVDKDLLIISGNSQKEVEEKEEKPYLLKELKRSSFKRTFSLNDKLAKDKISATFENGILKLDIPKKEEEVPTKIKVNLQ